MDEESLRNRLLNRLKEQQQSTRNEDVEMEISPEKTPTRHASKAIDSEISSGEMADSCEEDKLAKKKEKHKVHKSKKKHSKEQKGDSKEEAEIKKTTNERSAPKPETDNTSNSKGEERINGREIDKKKEKDKKQIRKGLSKSENKSPSPRSRRRHRRDTSPRQRYRRDRDRSNHSQQQRRRARYRSPDRRDRYHREDRHSPRRRGSRDLRHTAPSRSRRGGYSRSRSRSANRYSHSRSDSTTSFSISSYGSDMDTNVKEKNVMPATSTTSISGDKGIPTGFGQGLYIPQMNQPDKNKAGIGDLLSAIRQGQGQQSKSTAIAQYTAIFQQISAREYEQKDGECKTEEATSGDATQAGSKFKFVEQEFPVSHGSEHRKATFHSETGITGEQGEETQPFTDPASINKMLLGIKPGKYIGDKVTLLPLSLLEGGDPAWVKKNQFKGLAPVRDGFGRKLMEKMGWREGMPLGRSGYGAVLPLELDVKTDRKGLGVGSNYLLPLPLTNFPYAPVPINSIVSADSADPWSRVVEPNALAGGKHPVCVLMEICAKKHWHNPVFEEVGEQGPKYFKFKVITSMGCFQPQHSSVNKKEAKRQAALACLQALGQVPANTVQFVSSSIASANIPRPHIPQQPTLAPQFPMSVPRQMPLPPLTLPPLHLPNAPPYMRPSVLPPGGVGHTPVYQHPYSF